MSKQQRGFTLIELMISLVLGLTVMAGVMELFVQSQKTYKSQRAVSYMMQDGRYVLEVLSREIRRAGFLRNKNINGGSPTDVFKEDLGVLDSNDVSPAIDLLEGDPIKGVIKDAFAFRYQLYDDQDLGDSALNGSNSPCTQDLSLNLGDDPSVETHVVTLYFYVQNDPDDPNNTPVLYCKGKRHFIDTTGEHEVPLNPSAQPLISDVERLVVKYGIKNNNSYYYTDADGVSNWREVVTVKLFVVLRSEDDELVKNNTTYTIEGVTYTANDRRMYRVFSTTIALRND